MSGHYTLSLIATVIMLNLNWRGFRHDINDLPDHDSDVGTILAAVGLRRAPPTAI